MGTRTSIILDAGGAPVRLPVQRQANPGQTLVIERVGPQASLGYSSAARTARDNRTYSQYTGDQHLRYDREGLIDQSRALLRNNEIYKGMVEQAIDYIISTGFPLQGTNDSESLNGQLEALWNNWWARPEIRNLDSGPDILRLVLRELIVCGDNVTLKTDKGVLQILESEQIAHPTLATGIVVDTSGRPAQFYVCRYSREGRVEKNSATAKPASNVIYLVERERASQTRGAPILQSTFRMLDRIADVCDAEAIAWQMLSRLAVSVTKEGADEIGYQLSEPDADKTGSSGDDDLATRLTELDYALMFWGKPGEKVAGIERNIPGQNFGESLRMFLRLLGLPLGLPLELILLDWTKSNYSQSRAILEQAFRRFTRFQTKLIDHFLNPILEWKIRQWQKAGDLRRYKNLNKQIQWTWIVPTFPWIDQLKEAQAYAMRVERGFATHTGVCKSLGTDRGEQMAVREREVRDAIERAQQITADTGQAVPWEIFAGLKPGSSAGGFQGATPAGEERQHNEPSDDTEQEEA